MSCAHLDESILECMTVDAVEYISACDDVSVFGQSEQMASFDVPYRGVRYVQDLEIVEADKHVLCTVDLVVCQRQIFEFCQIGEDKVRQNGQRVVGKINGLYPWDIVENVAG